MILEAFAKYLRQADPQLHATEVLSCWLAERLLADCKRPNSVDKVIQLEITVERIDSDDARLRPVDESSAISHALVVPESNLLEIAAKETLIKSDVAPTTYVFKGASQSGDRLLKSLVEYCLSIEQQKWARFVHSLKASDFKKID